MKTFLDINVPKSKTFIIYGDLKDTIWCPDLIPRDFEHYLVRLLKSRGYEHVIFYGEAGTKGAYCLDAQSVRFFFSANEGIGLPHVPQGRTGGLSTGSQVSDALDSLFGGDDDAADAYEPGSLSGIGDLGEAGGREDNEAAQDSQQQGRRIRYAYRGQAMSEFIQKIHPLMLRQDSRMAVVFYNLLTTGFQNAGLRDDILDIWEKNCKGNICLILVPETSGNIVSLEMALRQYGLAGKFMRRLPNSEQCVLNDVNCIHIEGPHIDEIKHMLRYLAMVGTDAGTKIKFKYQDLETIAGRVVYACRANIDKPGMDVQFSYESMREIYKRISGYIDGKAKGGQAIEIYQDDIDAAWDLELDEGQSLKQLQKPGWGPAYDKVSQALEIAGKAMERAQRVAPSQGSFMAQSADWGVQRVRVPYESQGQRQIPNFVLFGNPGTGKTTIARLLGKILHEAGLLKTARTVEVQKESLTSSYIAGVPKETMARVREAEEGVLFIDEAHLLGKKDGGAGHGGTGVEVVSTLNAAMTDPNCHFSLVLAGYEDEMEPVFELDPGFKSRFGDNFINLQDYQPKLLESILTGMFESNGYRLHGNLIEEKQAAGTQYVPMQCMVGRLYRERDRKRFGNARDMATLADFAMGKSGDGFITQECFYGAFYGKIDGGWFLPMDIGAGVDDILNEMEQNFVGMEQAKEALKDIGLELEDLKERGIPADTMQLRPIILAGNPGTGKTSLANLLPKLYFHYQILGSARPIIVSASSLADKYAGGSQEKVLSYIKKAQDVKGFLFIDEAHELLNSHFDGRGAFRAFMAPVTDKEHPFLACFAVYPSKLDEFLAMDLGAKRRFRIIHLEDYTGPQLLAIMKRMMEARGCHASDETQRLLGQIFERLYAARTESTGNAGKAERILEDMEKRRRKRCKQCHIPFASEESRMFLPEDIPESFRKNLVGKDGLSAAERLKDIRARIQSERIGAEELKGILLRKADTLLYQAKFPKRAKAAEPGHYFFKGNPGTGKTTGASFFAKYLYELGLVQYPEPVFISASSLIGQYLGETGIKTKERLLHSAGKVLVIDEAYALAGTDSHADSYKRDAVNEIVNFLDNATYRKITCVIFAGYAHDMDGLYRMNSGLKSRVTEVAFEDFTPAQCMAVLLLVLGEEGVALSQAAKPACGRQIKMLTGCRDFANGRTIRRYADLLCGMMEKRCICHEEDYTEADARAYEIQLEDVPDDSEVRKGLNIG